MIFFIFMKWFILEQIYYLIKLSDTVCNAYKQVAKKCHTSNIRDETDIINDLIQWMFHLFGSVL